MSGEKDHVYVFNVALLHISAPKVEKKKVRWADEPRQQSATEGTLEMLTKSPFPFFSTYKKTSPRAGSMSSYFLKKLKFFFTSIELQIMVQFCYKGLYLGIENVCLSFVAADDKDGHGLKRECYARNNHPNNIVVSAP